MKTTKLSKPQSRSEIIAQFRERMNLVAPPVAPGTPTPTKETPPATDDKTPTSPVDDAIAALEKALADAKTAQAAEPDDKTDPNDTKVDDTLTQIDTLIQTLKAEQAKDETNDAPTPTDGTTDPSDLPADPKSKLAVSNTNPDITPIDDDGNVDANAACATDGCNHLGGAHANTADGDNAGPCSMENCACEAFTASPGTPSDPEGDDSDGSGDGDGGGPNNAGGDDTAPHSMAPLPIDTASPTPAMPSAPTGPSLAPPTSNPPPEVTPGLSTGIAFTIPVLVIEGQETGDGRAIALEALTWGAMPLPLMGLATATHDPNGMDMNDPAIMCGRIDSLERGPGENGTQIISATGYFLDNDDGQYFANLVSQMGRVGVSADIGVDESEETIQGMDEMGWPIFSSTLTAGTVQGCTIVPFPAFNGAYIITGEDMGVEAIPQQVADAISEPDAVTAGGFLIHYMANTECLPCGQQYDLVASGAPMHPPLAWFANPNFTEGDGRLKEIFTGRGEQKFGGAFACPPTITEEGRVFGHIAAWGTCHTGQPGACITPPHSKAGYAHFLRDGQRVMTAEGQEVTVGVLTLNAGHASTGRNVSAANAMAHYDNTATAFADVMVGEDEYGIWYAGALRPDLPEGTLRAARAASPSGDWREIGGNLELVATLMVNQPGFPIATVADGGRQVSLVAAGAYQIAELLVEEKVEDAFQDAGLRLVLAPMLEAEKTRIRQLKLEAQKADAKRRFAKLRKVTK